MRTHMFDIYEDGKNFRKQINIKLNKNYINVMISIFFFKLYLHTNIIEYYETKNTVF